MSDINSNIKYIKGVYQYRVTSDDEILNVDSSDGAITIVLPNIKSWQLLFAKPKKVITINDYSRTASTNNITVIANNNNINGSSSLLLDADGDTSTFSPVDNNEWFGDKKPEKHGTPNLHQVTTEGNTTSNDIEVKQFGVGTTVGFNGITINGLSTTYLFEADYSNDIIKYKDVEVATVDNVSAIQTDLTNHESDTNNPHNVTLEQARSENSSLSGDINANSNTIINLKDAVNPQEPITKQQFDTYISAIPATDITTDTTHRFVTDANLTVLGNTSGTNSGNETAATLGATINGAASATPNDTDLVATVESSVVKKITWTNVKAFLKTYFDGIYQPKKFSYTDTTLGTVSSGSANTLSKSVLISGGTLTNGALNIKARAAKTGSTSFAWLNIYVNTTNSLSTGSPTLIGQINSSSLNALLNFALDRTIPIQSGSFTAFILNSTNGFEEVVTNSVATVTIDWTIDQYIILAVQSNGGGDTLRGNFLSVNQF